MVPSLKQVFEGQRKRNENFFKPALCFADEFHKCDLEPVKSLGFFHVV
jgi:hypothetical protein